MSAAGEMSFTFLVESGPHAGVVKRLAPGRYALGSGDAADIVLADTALAPLHVLLELDRQGIRVEPLQGGARIGEADDRLGVGQARRLGSSATLVVGQTKITLRAPLDTTPRTFARPGLWFGGTALAAVLLLALLYAFDHDASAVQSAPPAAMATGAAGATIAAADPAAAETEAAADPAPAPAAAPAPPALPDLADLAEVRRQLAERLAAAGLARIELVPGAGRLTASGRITPDQAAAWQDVQAWFDRRFGQRFVLTAAVAISADAPAPALRVAAVWSGAEPYLVAGDGERYREGMTVGDGWRIVSIQPRRILLRRQDRTAELKL